MKRFPVCSGAAIALLLLCLSFQAAGLVLMPSDPNEQDDAPSEREIGYNEGFEAGSAACVAQCYEDPASCGITLGSCLEPAQFGETEPNDNIVAADELALEINFAGQSMSAEDQDWYFVVTSAPNQNLTVNFSVPRPEGVTDLSGWNLTGWRIAIRDARGNRLAGFDTDYITVDNPAAGISYRVTLGLVGAYYIVVEPTENNLSFHPYNIAAFLQDSDLDSEQYVIGYFDAELEPNDDPSQANRLANGVSMYGLINLTFDQALPSGEGYEYAQGESDWYQYTTAADELISLTFCVREACSAGNWLIEIYKDPSAEPLMVFNTDIAVTETAPVPETFHLGLRPDVPDEPQTFYMRIDHKRTFAAPCIGYAQDLNNDGFPDGELCGCESGYSCDITVPNPGTGPDGACPDGSGGPEFDQETGEITSPPENQCDIGCLCVAYGGEVEVPEGAATSKYDFTWYGTSLPTATVDTDAYQDFLNRANPLAP